MSDHHHDEYDLPEDILKKIKGYWYKPVVYSFEAKIKEINKEWVLLDNNYFYPEGGGQAADQGVLRKIDSSSPDITVSDVQIFDGLAWLKIKNDQLELGEVVNATIDKYRRESLSRNHSAQHLVSAVFWEELGLDTTRAEIRIDETQVELSQPPSLDDIGKMNLVINQLIEDNLNIESHYYNSPDQIKQEIRGSVETLDIYRLVTIGEYDFNLCGGTHVSSTKEIDNIFINKIESRKLRFYSGSQARKLFAQNAINLVKISRQTNAPFDKLPDRIDEILKKKDTYEKRIQKLETRIIENLFQLNKFKQHKNYYLKSFQVPTMNKGLVLNLSDNLTPKEILFISDENGVFILNTGSERLTTSIMSELQNHGIRGGGQGKFIMGRIDPNDYSMIISYLQDFL